jgi:hypothetical protein
MEMINMVKKKDEKKGKIDFVWAQFSTYPILENSGQKIGAEIGQFSDVKVLDTGAPKRDLLKRSFNGPLKLSLQLDTKNKIGPQFETFEVSKRPNFLEVKLETRNC